jgi:hypothetical protein
VILFSLLILALLPAAPFQGTLEGEAIRLAEAWAEGNLEPLAPMLSPGGIRLDLQGAVYPSVPASRAVGALQSFMERYPGGEVELARVSRAAGESSKGYAEFRWRTLVAGTGEPVIFTLFVAFSSENQAWTVTEIRVFS